jgi:S1-C subfamily serine protease
LGEEVYVAGYPYNSLLEGFNFTSGNVSSLVGFKKNSSNFKITAPVQPGNSGGPILNAQSAVIGVVVARIDDEYVLESTGTLPQNINIGIKNSVLKTVLSENNIETTLKTPFFKKSQQVIAETSKNASVLIKCYGQVSK